MLASFAIKMMNKYEIHMAASRLNFFLFRLKPTEGNKSKEIPTSRAQVLEPELTA